MAGLMEEIIADIQRGATTAKRGCIIEFVAGTSLRNIAAAVPDDAVIVDMITDGDKWSIKVWSESLPVVREGCLYPIIQGE